MFALVKLGKRIISLSVKENLKAPRSIPDDPDNRSRKHAKYLPFRA